jgi:hypothetical protein
MTEIRSGTNKNFLAPEDNPMRLSTVLAACAAVGLLTACPSVGQTSSSGSDKPVKVLPVPRPVQLPGTFTVPNRVCMATEIAGTAPMPRTAGKDTMGVRHRHQSIKLWGLEDGKTWLRFFPRHGSVVKFSVKTSEDRDVNPNDPFSPIEVLDFRLVNAGQPPVVVDMKNLTKDELCKLPAPKGPIPFQKGQFLFSVEPLQNEEANSVSEHVIVYAPIRVLLKDFPNGHDWFVMMIWHVRTAAECKDLGNKVERASCQAIVELSDLDPGTYDVASQKRFAKVIYPYKPSAAMSHNGVIHGQPN